MKYRAKIRKKSKNPEDWIFWNVEIFAFKCKKCLNISFNETAHTSGTYYKSTIPKYIYPSLTEEENKILEILINKIEKNIEISKLEKLIREFFLLIKMEQQTKSFKSAATLLSRKILMRFANYLGYKDEEYKKESVTLEIKNLEQENNSNNSQKIEKLKKFLRSYYVRKK